MAEGKRQLRGGKFVVAYEHYASDGKAAVSSTCCSPCLCCFHPYDGNDPLHTEATAVVTCGAGVRCDCVNYFLGSPTKAVSVTETYCDWAWTFNLDVSSPPSQCADAVWTLIVTYNKAARTYSGLFIRTEDGANFYFMGGNLDVICSEGTLAAAFTLSGAGDCALGGVEDCSVDIILS
ncbi:MAG TPA: hypothetical protein VNA25_09325 [Phycisphaerae bacterium]|nr:hypothetical protein [Phycisphaerae bacterium]